MAREPKVRIDGEEVVGREGSKEAKNDGRDQGLQEARDDRQHIETETHPSDDGKRRVVMGGEEG